MKTLLVMRHAKSSWQDESLSDFERPLSARGKRDAPRMGELLARLDLIPEVIIASSARRAADTADLLLDGLGEDVELITSRELYPGDPDDFLLFLTDLSDDYRSAMVIGHNPGIEDLCFELTGKWERMPTGAVMRIDFAVNSWQQLADASPGEIGGYWYPKML